MEKSLVTAFVDLGAIEKNVRNLKAMTGPSCRFMAVVKADGYGHGAAEVAERALESGADHLGVARLHEAVELREAGISAPILVFGYIHPSEVEKALAHDITITVYSLEQAGQISDHVRVLGAPLKTHVKVDTGMGRVGIWAEKNTVKEISAIASLPGLDLQGVYTHFAAADSRDKAYTLGQIKVFDALLKGLNDADIPIRIRHAANSAGIIQFPGAHYDMVRAGISLYGLYPSNEVDRSRVTLFPAMSLKSIVTSVRKVPKGFFVSYGMTHETKAETVLASVPVGYADGFSRLFSSNGEMLVRGQRARVAGRVCMDQTIIDVGHIPGVRTGDEVVLIGSQEKASITADELAGRTGTINYEIVSTLMPRVKRIYF